ncbi:hypothetical protein IL306_013577 [Fusarium sp. DS 682]|nr:hypothetical protein IL306_013577 [Fusarium sp. DS 682]
MSDQKQSYAHTVLYRTLLPDKEEWTMNDALRALTTEFWRRNPANINKDFDSRHCTIQEGDPGYEFWLEMCKEIKDWFDVSEGRYGDEHPKTQATLKKLEQALDAFYGDQHVVVDGERCHWTVILPDKASWIVDRFCDPTGAGPGVLSHVASILGVSYLLDIMEMSQASVGGRGSPATDPFVDQPSSRLQTPETGDDGLGRRPKSLSNGRGTPEVSSPGTPSSGTKRFFSFKKRESEMPFGREQSPLTGTGSPIGPNRKKLRVSMLGGKKGADGKAKKGT